MCGADTEFEKSLVITSEFSDLKKARELFTEFAPSIYVDCVLYSQHQDGSQPANNLFRVLVTQQYKNVFYEERISTGLRAWDVARESGYWNAHTRPLCELTQGWLEETQRRYKKRHALIRHNRENNWGRESTNVIDFVKYARQHGGKLTGWYLGI